MAPENDYGYWSRTASTYDDDNIFIIGDATNDAVKNWLRRQFSEDDHVLELGCGTGFCTRMIADLVGRITATDMSGDMLEIARAELARYDNIRVQAEDCCSTSFDDETFDVVLLANVIHVVRDPSAVLKESMRILKKSGRIVVVDYTSHGLSPDEKKSMMQRYFSRWGKIPEHSFAATPERLTKLAEDAGFQVGESILVGEGSRAACMKAVKV